MNRFRIDVGLSFPGPGFRLCWALVVAGFLGGLAQTVRGAEGDTPEAAARGFYATLVKHQVSGLPGDEVWTMLKPRMAPELAGVIEAARREQADFIKRNPDEKPPWIEGDLFSSLFEGPQEFAVGEATVTGDRADVPISFVYRSDGQTTKWKDKLVLTRAGGKWLVADVVYGATWDFGNKGTLLKGLKPGAG